jgi:hypothetical protein
MFDTLPCRHQVPLSASVGFDNETNSNKLMFRTRTHAHMLIVLCMFITKNVSFSLSTDKWTCSPARLAKNSGERLSFVAEPEPATHPCREPGPKRKMLSNLLTCINEPSALYLLQPPWRRIGPRVVRNTFFPKTSFPVAKVRMRGLRQEQHHAGASCSR